MARILVFLLACLCTALPILARDCSRLHAVDNCDDCFRCGAKWCKKPEVQRCMTIPSDDWCSGGIESPPTIAQRALPSNNSKIEFSYIEMTAVVERGAGKYIAYQSKNKLKVSHKIINSTQSKAIQLQHETSCSGDKCSLHIEVFPEVNFCSDSSGLDEYVNMQLNVASIEEPVHLKYHVPCACRCSKEIEKKSTACNGRGDLICGACSCQSEWEGENCEVKKIERGDAPCTSYYNNKECSGNGDCTSGTCACRTHGVGHQYLFPEELCADICLVTNYKYESCLQNAEETCVENPSIHSMPYNKTVLEQRSDIWVKCTEMIDNCQLEYATMIDSGLVDPRQYIMVIKSCNPEAAFAAGAGTTVYVPAILALLGAVAAAAAIAGYLAYRSRAPPLPLTDPQYQNIDAEDCVGENPLYKPPTSQFKNPTYGKW